MFLPYELIDRQRMCSMVHREAGDGNLHVIWRAESGAVEPEPPACELHVFIVANHFCHALSIRQSVLLLDTSDADASVNEYVDQGHGSYTSI